MNLKTYWLVGTVLLYGGTGVLPAAASDTAELTINGRVSHPTCSAEVRDNQLQQHCGNSTQRISLTDAPLSSGRGVTTQRVSLPDDASRYIIVNRYE